MREGVEKQPAYFTAGAGCFFAGKSSKGSLHFVQAV